MSTLKGKVALVTGSTSGIGQGIARALAAEGAHIVLNGFGDAAQIEADRAALAQSAGVKVLYDGADMSKPDAIRAMFARVEQELGGVDILVNNAGIQHVAPIDEFPDDKWDQIIAINLSSAFHCTKAAAKQMKAKGWGRILNVASVHGLVASEFKSGYISAKHGIVGMTKATALDLAPFGITVNAICPGYVDTPLVRKQIPDQAKTHGMSEDEVIAKVMLKNHAIKEFVSVEQLASLAVYLCSDGARLMTGTALPMDGGWSAH